jgi:hypothetical protein
MMNDKIPVDQIRAYLGRLTPQARGNLLVEIERMLLYGEEVPGAGIMLAELRAEFRKSGLSSDRAGNPSRYFFKPIEVLFVDRPPELANSGQISRGSLSAIWEWINQLLLPAMAGDYCEKMKQAIVTNNAYEAKLVASGFQSKVIKSLEVTLASRQGVDGVRTGLGRYTSSRASFDDLTKIVAALRVGDAIVAFGEALPPKIDSLEGEALAKARTLLDMFASKHPEAMPFAMTIVLKRLKSPWQLIHFATGAARGKIAADLEATRYAISVSMVLDHLDDNRTALKQAVRSNRIAIAKDILTAIYDTEHALRTKIGQLDASAWGRRLTELMTAIDDELQAEFRTLPDNIGHVLGARTLRRHSAPGLLTSLVRRSRDALVGGATRMEGLFGLGQRSAGGPAEASKPVTPRVEKINRR